MYGTGENRVQENKNNERMFSCTFLRFNYNNCTKSKWGLLVFMKSKDYKFTWKFQDDMQELQIKMCFCFHFSLFFFFFWVQGLRNVRIGGSYWSESNWVRERNGKWCLALTALAFL